MAAEFDDALDRCLHNIQLGRDTIESSLARYPQYADQLRPLLEIGVRVRPGPLAPLRPGPRARAKAQLLERADQLTARRKSVVTKRPMSRPAWLRLMPAAIALVMICSLAGLGMATASASSLPGDVLYPIKRMSEQVTIALAAAANRPELHVQFAQRRLDEFEALSVRGDFSQGLVTEAANEIANALSEVGQSSESGQQTTLQSIVHMADARQQALSTIAASAPVAERANLQSALDVLAARGHQAADLLMMDFPSANGPEVTAVATAAPSATTTPSPQATPTATPTPEPSPTMIATPGSHEPAVTPPGLARTPKPQVTPPGQVKPKTTPPGQVNPKVTPPGQDDSPPKNSPPGRNKKK